MKRILILDNDPDVLDVMQEALSYEGFDVSCAGETNDIFPLIDKYKPHVLVIDYILPGINGGELCHQVKSNPKTRNLPVMLMSAYPRVLMSLGDYGSDDFMPKPFDLDDLVNRISKLTSKTTDEGLHAV